MMSGVQLYGGREMRSASSWMSAKAMRRSLASVASWMAVISSRWSSRYCAQDSTTDLARPGSTTPWASSRTSLLTSSMTRSWVARSSRMRVRSSGLAATGAMARSSSSRRAGPGRRPLRGPWPECPGRPRRRGHGRCHAPATGDVVELGRSCGGELQLELGQPRGERGGLVLGQGERGGLVEQLLERDALVAVQRRVDEACSVTPTASTMTKRVLATASGVTDWKSAGRWCGRRGPSSARSTAPSGRRA
jgi:hypothetical protein